VPCSRSRSTAHSSRGHLTTSRLHHEDLSKCPTWRDPAWRSPGSPRHWTAERRSWPTSSREPDRRWHSPRPHSLFSTCLQWHFRFVRHRTFSESKPVTFTSLMSCRHALQRQVHLTSVSIQLSVSIYIISANLHAFLLLSSDYRGVLLNFACYYIFIRFSICWMILRLVKRQYYDCICWLQGAVKDKVKVKTTEFSRFFRSNDCKPPPGDVADMGILMMSLVLRYRNNPDTSCRKVAYVIGGIYDVMEWSRGHSVLSRRS